MTSRWLRNHEVKPVTTQPKVALMSSPEPDGDRDPSRNRTP
jgi:hypothetical protein